jgi:3-oxoacyl-[acyl-carrier protein] reductase
MRCDFTGKTVLVTGAGHGLGRAIARGFAALGAEVFGVDLDQAELEQTRREAGAHCQVRRLDVTDRKAVQALVAEAASASGAVSILVNNAGGVRGQIGRPLEAIEPADWQAIFDVNLSGPSGAPRRWPPA